MLAPHPDKDSFQSCLFRFFMYYFFVYSPLTFETASRKYFRSTIKTKKSLFVLYCPHLFVPLQAENKITHNELS